MAFEIINNFKGRKTIKVRNQEPLVFPNPGDSLKFNSFSEYLPYRDMIIAEIQRNHLKWKGEPFEEDTLPPKQGKINSKDEISPKGVEYNWTSVQETQKGEATVQELNGEQRTLMEEDSPQSQEQQPQPSEAIQKLANAQPSEDDEVDTTPVHEKVKELTEEEKSSQPSGEEKEASQPQTKKKKKKKAKASKKASKKKTAKKKASTKQSSDEASSGDLGAKKEQLAQLTEKLKTTPRDQMERRTKLKSQMKEIKKEIAQLEG